MSKRQYVATCAAAPFVIDNILHTMHLARTISLAYILSAHMADLFLTYTYIYDLQHGIREINPWARWLINEYGAAGLAVPKLLGLACALSIFALLCRRGRYVDAWLAFGVASMTALAVWWVYIICQIHS